MFEYLYKAMTSSDYKTDILGQSIAELTGKKNKKKTKVDDDALSVAKDLNLD